MRDFNLLSLSPVSLGRDRGDWDGMGCNGMRWDVMGEQLCSFYFLAEVNHGMLLLFFSMSFLSWDTVLQGIFHHGSFLKISVLQELLQTGSLPWSGVLQEWTAQLGPPCFTTLASKPAPVWDPLPGLQLLTRACFCMGYPWSADSFRYPGPKACCPPQALVWTSAPIWSPMGCRRTACLVMHFITGYSGVWSTSSPSSALILVSAGLLNVFPHFSLLKYTFPKTSSPWLWGSAMSCSWWVGDKWHFPVCPAQGSPRSGQRQTWAPASYRRSKKLICLQKEPKK